MEKKPLLACQQHNHQSRIQEAIDMARQICIDKGAKLTTIREQVLSLVWQSHRPLGAYAIMDILAAASARRVAPPTVYRALDFLLEHGLIHKINSLNAFVGCQDPQHAHQGHFLICRKCKVASELNDGMINEIVLRTSKAAGFSVQSHSLEVLGLCPNCQEN